MTEKEYLYLLSHTAGIGPVTIQNSKRYFHSFQGVWEASEKALEESGVFTQKRLEAFLACKKMETRYRKEYESLNRDKIRYITYMENEYPNRLQFFKDKPAGLFVKGNLPDDDSPTVAIVGARNCTAYGRDTAEYLAREMPVFQ